MRCDGWVETDDGEVVDETASSISGRDLWICYLMGNAKVRDPKPRSPRQMEEG